MLGAMFGQSPLVELIAVAIVILVWLALRGWIRAAADRQAARVDIGLLAPLAAAVASIVPWLVLALALKATELALAGGKQPVLVARLAFSLTLAWVVIRLVSRLVRNPRTGRAVAIAAWFVAALNIVGLIAPTLALLDGIAVTVGALRISLLLIVKAALLLVVLIWFANLAARVIEHRLLRFQGITPAMQVLASKLTRVCLLTLAVVIALSAVGIDLTAFAVFSGAIGVGIGFGLQKVVSNLISGVILLLDSSIKPGDVIALEGTYGWISQLNARYASVVTRDGTEHLIPNEDLITQRVINWTYSNDRIRLRCDIGIGYRDDPRRAIALCIEAALAVPRVLKDPPPVCLLAGFGDNSVNLQLRFWITDARGGLANVKSEVFLEVWDRFQSAGISLPFPQRDVHFDGPIEIKKANSAFSEEKEAKRLS